MNTSQFMDKQIMDLSNSQSNNDFINLMNPSDDRDVTGGDKKEDILPSYDFQPIRPLGAASSSPSIVDSGNVRARNSPDNNSSTNNIRNYSSFDSFEPAKVILEKDHKSVDSTLVSEIDCTMKKYVDNLMHALDGISARLTQLESRTRHLENSVDDLKVSVGNNHGSSDGKMRQLQHILREVQDGVQVVRDKQDILDAHLQLAKLQVSKVDQHADPQNTEHVDSSQPATSAMQQSLQQVPPVPLTQQSPIFPPPNAPPPPPSQQNILPQVQPQNQFLQNTIPSLPQREPYFQSSGQAPETLGPSYQPQPIQPSSPAHQQQNYKHPQPQYSAQLPPPPQPQPPPQSQSQPQQHPPLSVANLPQQQPPLGHHHEEFPYMQPQSYPPNIRQPPSHTPGAAPPTQQLYGAPPPNMYEPPSSRPSPGFSAPYGSSPGSAEPYPFGNSPSQYGSSPPMNPQQVSTPVMGHGGGSSYPQLPTARILPHALPTASGVGGGSPSSGSGNRVPIDDVIDKVTNMGFPRDHVRATVRKLTENGQSVDLNVVLDKLMNDGDVQPPRGWFGR